eukprot:scaffold167942_cov42-Cyclotella_meneghiniana.AAC.1
MFVGISFHGKGGPCEPQRSTAQFVTQKDLTGQTTDRRFLHAFFVPVHQLTVMTYDRLPPGGSGPHLRA